jgi:predicted acylesterase/phospholipase RssA
MHNADLVACQASVGDLLKRLKDKGYTVVLVGSVGAVPAIAASTLLWEIVEPFRDHIDSVRTASGSGVPLSIATTGVPAEYIRHELCKLQIRDVVDDIGLFAEHNKGGNFFERMQDVRAYYVGAFRAARRVMDHVTDFVGIIQGEVMQQLLARQLTSEQFLHTKPSLEVVATRDPQLTRHVFSHTLTPHVSISRAVVASCAMRTIFSVQYIDGQGYIDAAQNDPVPLESVVDDHVRSGKDPNKLFILGTFVHTLDRTADLHAHLFGRREHYDRGTSEALFYYQKRILEYQHISHVVFEFNAANIALPPAEPFFDFPVLGPSLSLLRKALATLTHRESVEYFLRGVSHYLYEQMNLQHLPLYFDAFEPSIKQKIARHIDPLLLS